MDVQYVAEGRWELTVRMEDGAKVVLEVERNAAGHDVTHVVWRDGWAQRFVPDELVKPTDDEASFVWPENPFDDELEWDAVPVRLSGYAAAFAILKKEWHALLSTGVVDKVEAARDEVQVNG